MVKLVAFEPKGPEFDGGRQNVWKPLTTVDPVLRTLLPSLLTGRQ